MRAPPLIEPATCALSHPVFCVCSPFPTEFSFFPSPRQDSPNFFSFCLRQSSRKITCRTADHYLAYGPCRSSRFHNCFVPRFSLARQPPAQPLPSLPSPPKKPVPVLFFLILQPFPVCHDTPFFRHLYPCFSNSAFMTPPHPMSSLSLSLEGFS